MKARNTFTNVALFAASSLIGLLVCEGILRAVVTPADFLSVEMVTDEVLGVVPSPAVLARGFDDWGFRNRQVPASADIVALGDSHTYGNTASMQDAWPHVLEELSGQTVYNMGLGGYGPNQYLHLLKTRALSLHPRTVLVGLYIGDDFENSYLITYGLDHWAYLRELPVETVDFNIWERAPVRPRWHKKLRVWLSRNSVVYQLVFHGPLLGRFQGELQIKNSSRISNDVVALDVPENNILEAFRPKNVLRILDQSDSRIREGMRITFAILKEMNDICREHNTEFAVVVIPTKEMVFAEHLRQRPDLPMSDVIQALLANEEIARAKTFTFLHESDISFVDTLPLLREEVGNQLYARTVADMHPNRNGYKVIAQAALQGLSSKTRVQTKVNEPPGSP